MKERNSLFVDPLARVIHILEHTQEDTPYMSVPTRYAVTTTATKALREFVELSYAGLGWQAQAKVDQITAALGIAEERCILVDLRDPNQKQRLPDYDGGPICFVVVDGRVSGEEYPRVS